MAVLSQSHSHIKFDRLQDKPSQSNNFRSVEACLGFLDSNLDQLENYSQMRQTMYSLYTEQYYLGFDGRLIKQVKLHKHVGIMLSQDEHISQITPMASQRIRTLYQI